MRASRPGRPAAWLALTALSAALAGPPAVSGDERTFRENVVVTAVEVPVRVLRDGEPVRGLTAADFEIRDRGERQEIVGFEVIDLSAAAAVPAATAQAAAATAAPAPPPAARARHFLFFFDLLFARPHRVARAVDGARRTLAEQLAPTDRASIAVYTRTGGVKLLTGFTTDRALGAVALDFIDALLDRDERRQRELAPRLEALWGDGEEAGPAALKRLSRQVGLSAALAITGGGLPDVMSLEEYDAIVGDGNPGVALSLAQPTLIDSRAVELEAGLHSVAAWSDAVSELATLLRDVPEPKHLLLFSEGYSTELLDNRETQGRATNWIQPAIDELLATGWPVEAIDVEGVPDALAAGGRDASAESDPSSAQFITGAARGQVRAPADLAGFDAQALFHLSHATGGQLVENFNDVAAATELALERISVTYLLVFQPRELVADGAQHDIEVRLREGLPGARVVHRPSYRAPKPLAERTPLELALDAAGTISGDRSRRDFDAAVLVVPLPLSESRTSVPLVIEIPGRELVRGRRAGSLEVELRAYGVVADESLADLVVQQVKLDLGKLGERLEAGGLRFFGELALPAGDPAVRVVVRELGGDKVFLDTFPVSIPVATAGELAVAPPLFLDRSGGFLALRQAAGDAARSSEAGDPFAVEDGALAPAAAPGLEAGEEPTVLVLVYPGDGGLPELESRVVAADGAAVPGAELLWLERLPDLADGARRLVGLLASAELAPGAYRLELTARGGGREAAASTPFTVRPSGP